jgi:hypothetical protein
LPCVSKHGILVPARYLDLLRIELLLCLVLET